MTREVRPLARALSLRRAELAGVHRAWQGDGRVAAVVGIGPVAAGRAAEQVLDAVGPDRVLVVGVAGAVDPTLGIGDVVVPAEVVERATGTVFRAHRPGARGILVTSDAIGGAVAGQAGGGLAAEVVAAEALAAETAAAEGAPGPGPAPDLPEGTSAVDMETAAIARRCEARGVPWSAVRTISDVPGTLDDALLTLVRADGGLDGPAVARFLARTPREVGRLLRIGRDTQRALRALTQAALREI